MTKTKHTWLIGVAAAALVVAGCSSSGSENTQQAGQAAPSGAVSSSAAPDVAHNDADVMFVQHMIPHHQQAIEMSDIIIGKADVDPQVVTLAKQIKGAQGPEIAQLQGWLDKWGDPPMPSMPAEDTNAPGGHGAPMAGMLSDEDIAALRNAPGPDAGPVFLSQMIAHHEGAISMAQDEVNHGEFPGAVEMATKIVTTQKREIDTMRGLLASM
jgi:uncharacterized protein (DUF305 family)